MRRPKWQIIIFLIYVVILLRITVFRSSFLVDGWCNGRVEWVPFLYLAKLIEVEYYSYFIYLFVGNIIWFVPLGIYIGMGKRSLLSAAICGFLLSLGIETAQYIFSTGVSEVEDVILNTFGSALGCLPFVIFKKKS